MNSDAIDRFIKEGASNGKMIAYGSARGPKIVISDLFEPIHYQEIGKRGICEPSTNPIIGFLSYDHLKERNYENSFFYKILRGFEIDFEKRVCRPVGEGSHDSSDLVRQFSLKNQKGTVEESSRSFVIDPLATDEQYLINCRKAIEWIKSGRFYQLNLLRYFRLVSAQPADLVSFWVNRAAQYGSLLVDREREIYSFSPERFIEIKIKSGKPLLSTFPIKGTRSRGKTLTQDLQLKNELLTSEKDRAELAMIVDLMRSDLSHVCKRSTVNVIDPGSILTFPSIYHLAAEIQGEMLGQITFDTLFRKTFPAGSITGAPKIEVMKAIYELEQRERNYFMGSAFYIDELGQFSSTVLIRTALKLNTEYQYAAGSGIVIKSDPLEEMEEIRVKCQVLTGRGK
jgi:para-aminobenzoate synthetase component 1